MRPCGPGASRTCQSVPSTGLPLLGRDLVALGYACCTEPQISAGRSRRPTRLQSNGRWPGWGGNSLAARRIDELSQGERARLALARVLATEADATPADEWFMNLDPPALEAATLRN